MDAPLDAGGDPVQERAVDPVVHSQVRLEGANVEALDLTVALVHEIDQRIEDELQPVVEITREPVPREEVAAGEERDANGPRAGAR